MKKIGQIANNGMPASANPYSMPIPKNISAIGLLNSKQHNDSPIPDKNAVPIACLNVATILPYA